VPPDLPLFVSAEQGGLLASCACSMAHANDVLEAAAANDLGNLTRLVGLDPALVGVKAGYNGRWVSKAARIWWCQGLVGCPRRLPPDAP
jgi:hypothetical protein